MTNIAKQYFDKVIALQDKSKILMSDREKCVITFKGEFRDDVWALSDMIETCADKNIYAKWSCTDDLQIYWIYILDKNYTRDLEEFFEEKAHEEEDFLESVDYENHYLHFKNNQYAANFWKTATNVWRPQNINLTTWGGSSAIMIATL